MKVDYIKKELYSLRKKYTGIGLMLMEKQTKIICCENKINNACMHLSNSQV
jgi:hypothetical protein